MIKITQPTTRDNYSNASRERAEEFTLQKMAKQYRPLLS
jgi:hypothetical protein